MKIKLDGNINDLSFVCHSTKKIYYFKFGNLFEIFEAISSTRAKALMPQFGEIEIESDFKHEDFVAIKYPDYNITTFETIKDLRKEVVKYQKQKIKDLLKNKQDDKGIYCIYNDTLNKAYIGSTSVSFYNRIIKHYTQRYIPAEIMDHPDTKIEILKTINSNNNDEYLIEEEKAINNYSKHQLINKELKPYMNKR